MKIVAIFALIVSMLLCACNGNIYIFSVVKSGNDPKTTPQGDVATNDQIETNK